MFKNHLKIAWRNLLQNKGFSLLNIFGLALGLAVTTLIFLWVSYEFTFDGFHANSDRIYQVYNKYPIDGEIWTWNSTPKVMAPAIKKEYPEVEAVSRFYYDEELLFSYEEKRLKVTGTIVDPDFLKIFSFPLATGNIDTVLKDVNSVVITENMAKKIFGDEPAIGKSIKIDNADLFTVTGILKDLPTNSEFHFEFLIPWSYLKQKGWDDKNWSNNSVGTYVLLKKGTNYETFSQKIKTLRKNYDKSTPDIVTYLYPYSRLHLYGEFEDGKEIGGAIDRIRLFAIIAIIVLLMACINFMNLSTARSEKRAKEVGVRKVVGANRGVLTMQFLIESILIAGVAALVALVVVWIALPSFNDLINKELSLDIWNPRFILSALGVILFTGILAGSYPAVYLSSFRPSKALKGGFYKVKTLFMARKVLVITQFSVAIILITATIIVRQQIDKVQDRQLGYNQNNLIYTMIEGDMEQKYDLIKKELLSIGVATSVAKTNSPVTESWSNSWGFQWKGKDKDDKNLIYRMCADDAVVKTLGLQLVEGRDFDLQQYPTDSTAAILNESAVKHMRFKNPIGQIVRDNGINWKVIGVIKDFVLRSPFQKVNPLMIEGAKGWFKIIHIKLDPSKDITKSLAEVQSVFKKYNPEYPFEYHFVDQAYAKKFTDQRRIKKIANLFAVLAILISCLGLFGLASYMAENRIKEIGIRKVLGASVGSITALLSKDFLKLVLIAYVIAVPITWYYMNDWLEDFDYRVTISFWFFVVSGILAIGITIITVSYQAIKAAVTNPIKSLRAE